jgi:hypothetical protein
MVFSLGKTPMRAILPFKRIIRCIKPMIRKETSNLRKTRKSRPHAADAAGVPPRPADAKRALHASETLQAAILNSLPAHIAVLDSEGRIVAVNEPWLEFARANGDPDTETVGVGANYFDVCKSACQSQDPHATAACAGLKSVLAGEQPRFTMEYPCDGPGCPRWFAMEVLRPVGNAGGAIVAHVRAVGFEKNGQ